MWDLPAGKQVIGIYEIGNVGNIPFIFTQGAQRIPLYRFLCVLRDLCVIFIQT
jgi:hypothetical protein